jgi:hypothetical protein
VTAKINRAGEFWRFLPEPTVRHSKPSHSFFFAGSAAWHSHFAHLAGGQKPPDSGCWSGRQRVVWSYLRFLSFPPDLECSRVKVYSEQFLA